MRISGVGKNDQGFTLIELMVVVVLIGVLSATILPLMQGTYEEALLRSTSRRVIGALNLARSQSVAVSRPHRVRLDTESERYFVERAAIKSGSGPDFEPLTEVREAKGKLDSRIAIEIRREAFGDRSGSGYGRSYAIRDEADSKRLSNAIRFFADGTAQGGEVRLRDRQGFGLAIRINPSTGGLRIARLERRPPAQR